jgi:hypothetical protein
MPWLTPKSRRPSKKAKAAAQTGGDCLPDRPRRVVGSGGDGRASYRLETAPASRVGRMGADWPATARTSAPPLRLGSLGALSLALSILPRATRSSIWPLWPPASVSPSLTWNSLPSPVRSARVRRNRACWSWTVLGGIRACGSACWEHVHLLFLSSCRRIRLNCSQLSICWTLLATHQYLPRQPAVRHDRGAGGRPIRALRQPPGAARPHPLDDSLPLVAQADPQTTRTQAKLVSNQAGTH